MTYVLVERVEQILEQVFVDPPTSPAPKTPPRGTTIPLVKLPSNENAAQGGPSDIVDPKLMRILAGIGAGVVLAAFYVLPKILSLLQETPWTEFFASLAGESARIAELMAHPSPIMVIPAMGLIFSLSALLVRSF